MRKVRTLSAIHRDQGAMAPYAVVAVIILLGAGVSYAYMAHLQTSRQALDSLDPWTDEALRTLKEEEARLDGVVRLILENVSRIDGNMSSEGIVSTMALRGQENLTRWVEANYPSQRGSIRVMLGPPLFTLNTLHGPVITGNVLGQQVPQRLPVGLEAVGAVRVDVTVTDGSRAGRNVVVRSDRLAPQVMAAHLQDVLEYTLADEGLVTVLMVDAMTAQLAGDPEWEPEEAALDRMVRGAIGAVQRSLFHNDEEAPWLPARVDGPDLLGLDTTGRVTIQGSEDVVFSMTSPRGGQAMQVRLDPRLEWRYDPQTDLRTSRLWGAEAEGGGEATIARLDIAGLFLHSVEVLANGVPVGNVTREVGFRDHLMAWAMDTSSTDDGEVHYGRAQVEDWAAFEEAMAVACPPPSSIELELSPSFGAEAEVTLDGVPLGIYGPGTTRLPNVLAGPHELTIISRADVDSPATCSTQVIVPFRGNGAHLAPVPSGEALSRAQYSFWFSMMAAFHRTDAGPLAHLEHIASLSGYPLLPAHVMRDPAGNLEQISFWVEGLEHHLDHQGGQWDDKGVMDPLGTMDQAKQVVKLSKLAYKLLTKLPKAVSRVSTATMLLSTEQGRTEFVLWSETGSGMKVLLKGTVEDGGCTVRSAWAGTNLVARIDNVLTAISIITGVIAVYYAHIEFVDALEGGDVGDILWAYTDLQLDMAKLVISLLGVLGKVGVLVIGALGKAVLSVVGAAIAVVATFLDAYRDAGNDFWGAWEILLHPDGFSGALRTAGFFSAVASIITTVVLTVALPVLTGATVAGAFILAVGVATGVGLIVLAAVLVVWAIMNWDSITNWVSGTVGDEEVDAVEDEVESILRSTMELRARMNSVDVHGEVAEARSERGVGLALMHLRTLSGNADLVMALGLADLAHLDGGSAQGRRARAVHEVRYWIDVLWREVDDLRDEDRRSSGGEDSEGFRDYKGSWGSKDHDFDADIKVSVDGGARVTLVQDTGGIDAFLRDLSEEDLGNTRVDLEIAGSVYGDGLKDWLKAIGAIGGELSEATGALARASRESAFVSSFASESDYDRQRGLVQIQLPETVDWAKMEIWSVGGSVFINGQPVERGTLEVTDGSAMFTATGYAVQSKVLDWDGGTLTGRLTKYASCMVLPWHDVNFGVPALRYE